MNNGDILYSTALIEDGGHAIVIVGYDPSDNSIIFMDPMTGNLRESSGDNPFNITDIYIIKDKTN